MWETETTWDVKDKVSKLVINVVRPASTLVSTCVMTGVSTISTELVTANQGGAKVMSVVENSTKVVGASINVDVVRVVVSGATYVTVTSSVK